MLTNIKKFVKDHQANIVLITEVVLISLLSFAIGYIVAKTYDKQSLEFNEFKESGYYWGRDNRSLSCL